MSTRNLQQFKHKMLKFEVKSKKKYFKDSLNKYCSILLGGIQTCINNKFKVLCNNTQKDQRSWK